MLKPTLVIKFLYNYINSILEIMNNRLMVEQFKIYNIMIYIKLLIYIDFI